MHAEHSANGTLRSGATVKRAVSIIEEHAFTYIDRAVDQVAEVAKDVEAFTLIVSSFTALFRGFEPHLDSATRLATAGTDQRTDSVRTAGLQRFLDTRTRAFKQLEIHRFSFVRPSRGDLAASGVRLAALAAMGPPVAEKRNAGGKPLAAHWDAMWAAIAVKLWTGELKPKSQADVKKAMVEWLNEAEIDVGDTALTQRARQLWQAMQNADS